MLSDVFPVVSNHRQLLGSKQGCPGFAGADRSELNRR